MIVPVDVLTKFCARATFVPKADRVSLCLVTDLRGLNRIIKMPVWPYSYIVNYKGNGPEKAMDSIHRYAFGVLPNIFT